MSLLSGRASRAEVSSASQGLSVGRDILPAVGVRGGGRQTLQTPGHFVGKCKTFSSVKSKRSVSIPTEFHCTVKMIAGILHKEDYTAKPLQITSTHHKPPPAHRCLSSSTSRSTSKQHSTNSAEPNQTAELCSWIGVDEGSRRLEIVTDDRLKQEDGVLSSVCIRVCNSDTHTEFKKKQQLWVRSNDAVISECLIPD